MPKEVRPARPKNQWRRVDGVLLLDKPVGLSSNDALQKARRLLRAAKGGHTGTLDPLASGLLPLCFGEATKFSHDLLGADKTYETTLNLGVTTDSGDRDGTILDTRPVDVEETRIRQVVAGFLGPQQQIPPMHSALKRDGVPLYRLARQGISVERPPRGIVIHAIDVLGVDLPLVRLRVCCSKGTYIRVLGQDIGEALGCGAHLAALRRTHVGPLSLVGGLNLTDLADAVAGGTELSFLQQPDTLVRSLPPVTLEGEALNRVRHGNAVRVSLPDGDRFRLYASDGNFLGTGLRSADGRLQPERLVNLAGDEQESGG